MKKDLLIIYAVILQAITAVFVFISPVPIEIARLGIFYDLFPTPQIGAFLMAIGVILSFHAMFLRKKSKWYFLFFFPQFFFLLLTTGSAINYVLLQRYADGVIRPWYFIFLDQLPSFVATSLYPFAMFNFREDQKNG